MRNQEGYIYLIKKMIAARKAVHGYDGDITLIMSELDPTLVPIGDSLSEMLQDLQREKVNMEGGRGWEIIISGSQVNADTAVIHGSRTDRLKKFIAQMTGRDPRTRRARRILANPLNIGHIPVNDWSCLRITIVNYTHMQIEYKETTDRWHLIKADVTCDELGMGSRQRNLTTPGVLWKLLSHIASRNGLLNFLEPETGGTQEQKRQNKSKLTRKLQFLFKLPKTNNPFEKTSKSLFKTKFVAMYSYEMPETWSDVPYKDNIMYGDQSYNDEELNSNM